MASYAHRDATFTIWVMAIAGVIALVLFNTGLAPDPRIGSAALPLLAALIAGATVLWSHAAMYDPEGRNVPPRHSRFVIRWGAILLVLLSIAPGYEICALWLENAPIDSVLVLVVFAIASFIPFAIGLVSGAMIRKADEQVAKAQAAAIPETTEFEEDMPPDVARRIAAIERRSRVIAPDYIPGATSF